MVKRILLFSILIIGGFVQAQTTRPSSEMLIKGGHVIDPKNNINAVMDVAISDGKITQVARNITPKSGALVINAAGMYVTPGLIDMHGHFFPGAGRGDPFPDGFTFRNGVTTGVDAGSSGWKSFPDFKKETIDKAETRILAFLNIGAEGYRRINGRGNESDTSTMSAKLAAECALKYKDIIVGIKDAHFSGPDHFIPLDRGIEAGRIANIPFMLDDDLEDRYLKRFRPGDIYTHIYGQELIDPATGKMKPFIVEAQKRGIIFDFGFGGNNLDFKQAIPAIKNGFFPNTMGTDMNYHSFNGAMQGLLNVMSTMLAMGMNLPDLIRASTWKPAQVIKHEELGHLSVGAIADVAILNMRQGNFGVRDTRNFMIETKQKLECEVTIKGGKVMYDINGRTFPDFRKTAGGK